MFLAYVDGSKDRSKIIEYGNTKSEDFNEISLADHQKFADGRKPLMHISIYFTNGTFP